MSVSVDNEPCYASRHSINTQHRPVTMQTHHSHLRTYLFAFPSILALLLLAPVMAPAKTNNDAQNIDRIVAIINDDVITASELKTRLAITKVRLGLEKIAVPSDETITRQLLERMTIERMQLQLADRFGIKISEQEIDQTLTDVAMSYKLTQKYIATLLTKHNVALNDFRNVLKEQLIIREIINYEVTRRVNVSESEIRHFLENRELQKDLYVEYKMAHIFIGVPETATTALVQQAKKLADHVYQELKAGENFERAAVTYSQSADALQGGALGWRKAGQVPDIFLSAIQNLTPGQFSGVIRGPNGFHILKLDNKRGGEHKTQVMQTHVRHILLRPSEIQSLNDVKHKLNLLRERIVAGEDFAAMARAHSEDATSSGTGGKIGWVNPGDLHPSFEKAMSQLNEQELSQAVITPFGGHLIQVLGRRQQDITDDRMRAAAKTQIHARKVDERYESWLRRLRSEAYVKILLEDQYQP
jgi:peptidyl-prolyl cis-trans isomerase SurA